MLDIPVFRQPVQVGKGMRTSPDRACKYKIFQRALKALSLATRFKQVISVYVIRRATGSVVNGMK